MIEDMRALEDDIDESKEKMKELRKEKDILSNDIERILKKMRRQQTKRVDEMIETNTMDTYKENCAICLDGFHSSPPHELGGHFEDHQSARGDNNEERDGSRDRAVKASTDLLRMI
uniref:C2H2-type domain-containing protein n=1 Tax=Caenorhabditis tropicalis TaxID=1561998 RepID=A0A1I7TT71_9PELO